MVTWVALAATAQAAQVLLQVQPEKLVEGQSGTARLLVVSNAAGRQSLRVANVPVVDHGDGLSIGFDGQSSEFRITNGEISQILSFSYRITALKTGRWKVGPVDVVLADGSRVATNAATIEVTPRSEAEEARPEVEVRGGFGVDRAYEGQMVLYEYRFASTNLDARAEWQFPTFEGLRQPQEGQATLDNYVIDDPSGAILVAEGAVPLIASGTGTRTYPPAIAKVQIPIGPQRRLLFRRVRTDPYATEPAELTIVPLPEAPPTFSGLVGDFEVRSSVNRTKAVVGQSIAWTVQVVGDGSLEGFALPPYEAPGGTVYDNDVHVVANIGEEGYQSAATFRRVLVPTAPGGWTPPSFELITFSPTKAAFVTHELTIPPITVRPGREGTGEVTSFAPEATDLPPDAQVDMAPREILRTGRANAWRLGGWLPFAFLLTALPGLGLWLRDLGQAAWTWWEQRSRPVEVEKTAAEVIADLPRNPALREAALETALRLAIDEFPDDDELQQLFSEFLRARFGDDTVNRDLEVRIRTAIERLAEAS